MRGTSYARANQSKRPVSSFSDEEDEIVGHVPHYIISLLSSFLKRDCNKGFAEVTGNALNCGAGYGMEVACKYRLYGLHEYITRL